MSMRSQPLKAKWRSGKMGRVRIRESTAVALIRKGICGIDDFEWEDNSQRQSLINEFGGI